MEGSVILVSHDMAKEQLEKAVKILDLLEPYLKEKWEAYK